MGRKPYIDDNEARHALSAHLGATAGIEGLHRLGFMLSPGKAPELWTLYVNTAHLSWAARNSVIYG